MTNTATYRTLALQYAQGQLGQSEKPIGSNGGPMVDKYLASVGLKPGYSWCQAFTYWCYQQAAIQLKGANPVVKTAGVIDCWNKTAVQFKILQAEALAHPELIKPGYQFILDFGKGEGHTGIIERVDVVAKMLITIEGNSNDNGSREGYEVVRRVRALDSTLLKGIIIYN